MMIYALPPAQPITWPMVGFVGVMMSAFVLVIFILAWWTKR